MFTPTITTTILKVVPKLTKQHQTIKKQYTVKITFMTNIDRQSKAFLDLKDSHLICET